MTIEKAIKHCEEVADSGACKRCRKEHKKLAKWLKRLKESEAYKWHDLWEKPYELPSDGEKVLCCIWNSDVKVSEYPGVIYSNGHWFNIIDGEDIYQTYSVNHWTVIGWKLTEKFKGI